MDALFTTHHQMLEHTSSDFIRYLYNEIRWNNRLISIVGAIGSGKTTLILQYIKQNYKTPSPEALYVSLDNIWFSTHTSRASRQIP